MNAITANLESDGGSAIAPSPDKTRKFVRSFGTSRVAHLAAFLLASGPLTSLADDIVHRERLPHDFASTTIQDYREANTLVMESSTTYMKYKSRIAQLQLFAEEDGISVNLASQREFLAFAYSDPSMRQASLVLLDNGNFRAVWRTDEKKVGAQFFGDGMAQLSFSRQNYDGNTIRKVERVSVLVLWAAIRDADLGHLLYE